MDKVHLQLKNVCVGFSKELVVRDVSFKLEKGQIGCLVGPSGCGKTTLLRAIAGFEGLRAGSISLVGKEISNSAWKLPPEKRSIGIVFQEFALYPHLSVEKNIAFGLHGHETQDLIVDKFVKLVGLEKVRKHFPYELSGGQQQRVALARALAPGPEVLLLDEPFSQLDPHLKERLIDEMKYLFKSLGTTVLMVSHQQDEAFDLADSIGVMREGNLLQWQSPYELYHRPGDKFVSDFIGRGVFLPGEVVGPGQVKTEIGLLNDKEAPDLNLGAIVQVLVRPDDVIHDDESNFQAEVVGRYFRGPYYLYHLRLATGRKLMALVQSHHDHPVGSHIGIKLELDHLVCFSS